MVCPAAATAAQAATLDVSAIVTFDTFIEDLGMLLLGEAGASMRRVL